MRSLVVLSKKKVTKTLLKVLHCCSLFFIALDIFGFDRSGSDENARVYRKRIQEKTRRAGAFWKDLLSF